MSGIFTFKDNSTAVKRDLEQKLERALTVCGDIAVDYAKDNLRDFPRVDTGQLRNSMDSEVVMDEQAIYIGTNVEYAPYVEYGTVRQKAQPYLRPGIEDHLAEYNAIFQKELEKG